MSTDTGLVLEGPVVVVPKPQGTSCTKGKKSKGKDKTANKDGFITPSETRNEPGSGTSGLSLKMMEMSQMMRFSFPAIFKKLENSSSGMISYLLPHKVSISKYTYVMVTLYLW